MTYSQTALRCIAALALSASAAMAEPLPCQGRYNVMSGDVIMSSGGMVHVEPRNRNEGDVDLIYDGCDRIRMEGQGARMDLIRSASSGWTATLTGGGATRIFRFNALTPRLIDSWMDAVGGGMQVQRGMKLTLVNGTDHQPVDCIFDGERHDFTRENAAARMFLAARNLAPPSADFAPQDYFRTSKDAEDLFEAHGGSSFRILFLLGRGNRILPATRAATRFREICRAETGALDPPRRFLTFKILEVENPHGFDVFARIIDIETGKIIAQRESEVTGTDDAALSRAMQDAATQLNGDGVTFGPLSDGNAG